MKKTLFPAVLALVLIALSATACNLLDNDIPDGGVPNDVSFYTGCPLSFYFVDENGNDLVQLEDRTTWPTAFRDPAQPSVRENAVAGARTYEGKDGVVILYNNDANSLWMDPDEGLSRFQTFFWGVTPEQQFAFPVYLGESEDLLTVGYKYLTSSDNIQITGASWAVEITSVKYNGVEVFVGNEKGKVFVTKPSQGGDTTVRIGSI